MATDPKQNTKDTQESAEPQGWRPDTAEGATTTLTGVVEEVSKGWSDYTDSFYPIVTIREKDTGKLVAVHCFHEILKQRMMDARPEVGQELEITCTGQHGTRDGKRSYVGYRVTIPGDTGARVWDDLGAQPSTAAASAAPKQDEIPF